MAHAAQPCLCGSKGVWSPVSGWGGRGANEEYEVRIGAMIYNPWSVVWILMSHSVQVLDQVWGGNLLFGLVFILWVLYIFESNKHKNRYFSFIPYLIPLLNEWNTQSLSHISIIICFYLHCKVVIIPVKQWGNINKGETMRLILPMAV